MADSLVIYTDIWTRLVEAIEKTEFWFDRAAFQDRRAVYDIEIARMSVKPKSLQIWIIVNYQAASRLWTSVSSVGAIN